MLLWKLFAPTYEFFCVQIKMAKPKLPKIFRVKKDKENPDQYIVRHKNLSKQQAKELKAGLDEYCKAYFADPQREWFLFIRKKHGPKTRKA